MKGSFHSIYGRGVRVLVHVRVLVRVLVLVRVKVIVRVLVLVRVKVIVRVLVLVGTVAVLLAVIVAVNDGVGVRVSMSTVPVGTP